MAFIFLRVFAGFWQLIRSPFESTGKATINHSDQKSERGVGDEKRRDQRDR
jgi:hypothetical protein